MGFKPDEIAMAASCVISKLTASGQIGSDGKTEKTYTFDGVVGDRPNANGLVFISSDLPDINSIKSVSAIFNGQLMTVGKDGLTIQDKTTGMDDSFSAAYFGEYPAVYINFNEVGLPAGFYVLCGDENNYVTSVTFESGEVKPADPKYITKVLDFDNCEVNSVLNEPEISVATPKSLTQSILEALMLAAMSQNKRSKAYAFYEDYENSPIYKLFQQAANNPCLNIKFTFDGTPVVISGGTVSYSASRSGVVVQIVFSTTIDEATLGAAATVTVVMNEMSSTNAYEISVYVTPLGAAV